MVFQKIAVASDHAGKECKHVILDFLKHLSIEVVDYGIDIETQKSVDYPDYAELLANDLSRGTVDGAIAICGTGLGMAISGNKFAGVRATPVWDEYTCRLSRQHNNANMLCLGGRTLNYQRAAELTKLWLETDFLGDRHKVRLDKIVAIEKKSR